MHIDLDMDIDIHIHMFTHTHTHTTAHPFCPPSRYAAKSNLRATACTRPRNKQV